VVSRVAGARRARRFPEECPVLSARPARLALRGLPVRSASRDLPVRQDRRELQEFREFPARLALQVPLDRPECREGWGPKAIPALQDPWVRRVPRVRTELRVLLDLRDLQERKATPDR
jgi:hypothetical protein